jgi:4'-phosphopantetheinyl transferase EntD
VAGRNSRFDYPCGSWAIAAAAVSSVALSIRIDLENPDQIQTDDIAGLICRDAERKWAVEDGHYGNRLVMLFSAKVAA